MKQKSNFKNLTKQKKVTYSMTKNLFSKKLKVKSFKETKKK
jgi:hypothetical protein